MPGGNGGTPFEDEPYGEPRAIHVFHGAIDPVIDYLMVEYEGGYASNSHGNQFGGTTDLFHLAQDEITVFIWANKLVEGLQFHTSKGRPSKKFGGGEGLPYVRLGTEKQGARALLGFRGRSGLYIDYLETRGISGEEAAGSDQGKAFHDLLHIEDLVHTSLRKIRIWEASYPLDVDNPHFVVALQTIHKKGDILIEGDVIGKPFGELHEFVFEEDEFVTRIQGQAESAIDVLTIVTDFGPKRTVGRTQNGHQFLWDTPGSPNDPMYLLGFAGKHGMKAGYGQIHRLSPIWAANPRIRPPVIQPIQWD